MIKLVCTFLPISLLLIVLFVLLLNLEDYLFLTLTIYLNYHLTLFTVIYGVPMLTLPMREGDFSLHWLMIAQDSLGYFCLSTNLKLQSMCNNFSPWFILNLVYLSNALGLIMLRNLPSLSFWIPWALFINFPVLKGQNKIQ